MLSCEIWATPHLASIDNPCCLWSVVRVEKISRLRTPKFCQKLPRFFSASSLQFFLISSFFSGFQLDSHTQIPVTPAKTAKNINQPQPGRVRAQLLIPYDRRANSLVWPRPLRPQSTMRAKSGAPLAGLGGPIVPALGSPAHLRPILAMGGSVASRGKSVRVCVLSRRGKEPGCRPSGRPK